MSLALPQNGAQRSRSILSANSSTSIASGVSTGTFSFENGLQATPSLGASAVGSSSAVTSQISVGNGLSGTDMNGVEEEVRKRVASQVQLVQRAGADESLRSFKLLEALRSGHSSQILPLLPPSGRLPAGSDSASLNRTMSGDGEGASCNHGMGTALYLAVRCATTSTVQMVLSNTPPSMVALPDSKGQTPLHLACALNRPDVVAILLAQPAADDSIRDVNGNTCLEVCKSAECAKMIQISRAQLNGSYLGLLAAYASSSPQQLVTASPPGGDAETDDTSADQIFRFLERPRTKVVDLNARDEATGSTLLHEAAKRKDLLLLKQAILRGADVLARDKRNKMPIDIARDERVKVLLRQTATTEGRALRAQAQGKALPAEAATMVATHNSSSGSISGVLSGPPVMKGYLSKWTNMARGYHTRWIALENGYLSYYRDQQEEGKNVRGSISMAVAVIHGPEVTKNKLQFEVSSNIGKSASRIYFKAAHPVEAMRWVDALRHAAEHARSAPAENRLSVTGQSSYKESMDTDRRSFVSKHLRRAQSLRNPAKTPGLSSAAIPTVLELAPPLDSMASSHSTSVPSDDDSYAATKDTAPFDADVEVLAQSIKTHIEMTEHLLGSLSIPATPQIGNRDTSGDIERIPSVRSQRAAEVKEALASALRGLDEMIDDYVSKIAERERFHVRRYERELAAKELWAANMAELAAQQTQMEKELQQQAQSNSRRKKQIRAMRLSIIASEVSPPPVQSVAPTEAEAYRDEALAGDQSGLPSTPASPILNGLIVPKISVAPDLDEDSENEDEDDDFFDAIEQGAIVPATPHDAVKPLVASECGESDETFKLLAEGYEQKRTRLPISADDRPTVSLWGILKNSIGKDLTKISFPVSFNEPVSMLQRMAEDMEFTECLDAAATSRDSLRRIAYVAAFAMSNYSSTVGRIAKPFNPMLGETFEYIDLEKQYRYISEQVSHHPPMSACMAESPRWLYYGEVDAKNKFTGKAFEIRPTGVAHATLRLPKEWAPGYPPDRAGSDSVEEHYSWKKVTTVVSNFILGSPTIDHYGDMEVTNHRTGERCVLTFKPRGWRGKDANEIKGTVFDANDAAAWDIAGKWTTQLVARRTGIASGDLPPDATISDSSGPEYLLLWKKGETPAGAPFNFTKYTITLNDLNDCLRPCLPPTDCRLRPDQHAFERGAWEKANELKTALEEFQRSTRRKREIGELPPHRPRWYNPTIDEDTGERVWEPVLASDGKISYWEERLQVQRARKAGQHAEWRNVDHIFGQFGLADG